MNDIVTQDKIDISCLVAESCYPAVVGSPQAYRGVKYLTYSTYRIPLYDTEGSIAYENVSLPSELVHFATMKWQGLGLKPTYGTHYRSVLGSVMTHALSLYRCDSRLSVPSTYPRIVLASFLLSKASLESTPAAPPTPLWPVRLCIAIAVAFAYVVALSDAIFTADLVSKVIIWSAASLTTGRFVVIPFLTTCWVGFLPVSPGPYDFHWRTGMIVRRQSPSTPLAGVQHLFCGLSDTSMWLPWCRQQGPAIWSTCLTPGGGLTNAWTYATHTAANTAFGVSPLREDLHVDVAFLIYASIWFASMCVCGWWIWASAPTVRATLAKLAPGPDPNIDPSDAHPRSLPKVVCAPPPDGSPPVDDPNALGRDDAHSDSDSSGDPDSNGPESESEDSSSDSDSDDDGDGHLLGGAEVAGQGIDRSRLDHWLSYVESQKPEVGEHKAELPIPSHLNPASPRAFPDFPPLTPHPTRSEVGGVDGDTPRLADAGGLILLTGDRERHSATIAAANGVCSSAPPSMPILGDFSLCNSMVARQLIPPGKVDEATVSDFWKFWGMPKVTLSPPPIGPAANADDQHRPACVFTPVGSWKHFGPGPSAGSVAELDVFFPRYRQEVDEFSKWAGSAKTGLKQWMLANHPRASGAGYDANSAGVFLKAEGVTKYDGVDVASADQYERIITPRPEGYQVDVGPTILAYSKQVAASLAQSNIVYPVGMDALEAAEAFSPSITASHGVEGDFSRFDGRLHLFLLAAEYIVYSNAGFPPEVLRLLAHMAYTTGRTISFYFQYFGRRRSGDPNTSLGNTIIQVLIWIYALAKHWKLASPKEVQVHLLKTDARLGLMGDDSLFLDKAAFDPTAIFQALGLKYVVKTHGPGRLPPLFRATFCSHRVLPVSIVTHEVTTPENVFATRDTYVLAPLAGRAIAKLGYYFTGGDRDPVQMAADRVLADSLGRRWHTCVPFLRVALNHLIASNTGGKVEPARNHHELHAHVEDFIGAFGCDVKVGRSDYEWSVGHELVANAFTFEVFQELYGLSSADEDEYFSALTTDCMSTSYTWDRVWSMLAVDGVVAAAGPVCLEDELADSKTAPREALDFPICGLSSRVLTPKRNLGPSPMCHTSSVSLLAPTSFGEPPPLPSNFPDSCLWNCLRAYGIDTIRQGPGRITDVADVVERAGCALLVSFYPLPYAVVGRTREECETRASEALSRRQVKLVIVGPGSVLGDTVVPDDCGHALIPTADMPVSWWTNLVANFCCRRRSQRLIGSLKPASKTNSQTTLYRPADSRYSVVRQDVVLPELVGVPDTLVYSHGTRRTMANASAYFALAIASTSGGHRLRPKELVATAGNLFSAGIHWDTQYTVGKVKVTREILKPTPHKKTFLDDFVLPVSQFMSVAAHHGIRATVIETVRQSGTYKWTVNVYTFDNPPAANVSATIYRRGSKYFVDPTTVARLRQDVGERKSDPPAAPSGVSWTSSFFDDE